MKDTSPAQCDRFFSLTEADMSQFEKLAEISKPFL